MGPRYRVDLLQVVLPSDSLFLLWALFSGAISMASIGSFDLTVYTLSSLPTRSQELGASQVVEDRMALCDNSRRAKLGSTSPSFRLPYGSVLCSCSPSCSSTSTLCLPFGDGTSGLCPPSGGCALSPCSCWVFVGCLWFALALLWQCLRWQLVCTLALS
jgi:hypothetical protein